jgi:Pirin-related protein
MNWSAGEAPERLDVSGQPAIETTIVPRPRDLGGFEVQRLLPSSRRRMVGPFIFFDRIGPVTFAAGRGLDVAPHPHIGLATVTYLLAGEIVHRDSLGTRRTITPGAVNWMTAGRGIAHSERTAAANRHGGARLFGIQAWVALPRSKEEIEPGFVHHDADALPRLVGEGWNGRLIAGAFEGVTAPTPVFSPTLYADVALEADARLPFAADQEERAVYVIEGTVELDGNSLDPGVVYALAPRRPVTLRAVTPVRLILFGGATMDGPRHVWWNFVSSSRDRIEQAKADWAAQRFEPVPGEADFVPLPAGP